MVAAINIAHYTDGHAKLQLLPTNINIQVCTLDQLCACVCACMYAWDVPVHVQWLLSLYIMYAL